MIKIAITGPESTGKSTLAQQLANYYGTIWVEEDARNYIQNLKRPYRQPDLLEILNGQLKQENLRAAQSRKLLFCDTEALVIKIWSEYKYGNVDPAIMAICSENRYDHYLLMNVDLPWVPDPQREHPDKRAFFFNWFERELQHYRRAYTVINGNEQDRFCHACIVIDSIISKANYS